VRLQSQRWKDSAKQRKRYGVVLFNRKASLHHKHEAAHRFEGVWQAPQYEFGEERLGRLVDEANALLFLTRGFAVNSTARAWRIK